jgi:hypothetical protein
MQLQPFPQEDLQIQYEGDKNSHPIVMELQQGKRKHDYHLRDVLMYTNDQMCILDGECRNMLLREGRTSKLAEHFRAVKTLLNM